MAEERVQRRLAAILAADVVGYSQLMDADEAGTLWRLKELRRELFEPKTKEHGGRIFKTTGDGALVEFKSAVDAVNSAINIQQSLTLRNQDLPDGHRIELRIGISLGDVIVEGSDLYGNGVNVAARMEGLAEPGSICVSGNVYEHISRSLDVHIEDLGEQSIKNIDRPVQCYRVHAGADVLTVAPASPVDNQPLALPAKPSIAVLPFSNMSGDPEQEYFSDGITEDLITALSRMRWLFVVARNSTFSYKGQAPDVREVARNLGVHYVLEGSVRKSGNRVRITAQLIHGLSGNHLWAERYDREVDDVFALQDELTLTLCGAIEPELVKSEQQRIKFKAPQSMDAWDCCQRGMWLWQMDRQEKFAEARSLFERAMELDPSFSRTFVGYVGSYFADRRLGISAGDRGKALQAANRAIELDTEDAWSHWALGLFYYVDPDPDSAIPEFEHAIRLNPSFADAHSLLGNSLASAGRAEEAVPHIEQAIRLSPRDPIIGIMHARMGRAYLFLRQHEKAAEWGKSALRQQNVSWPTAAYFTSTLGHLGRLDEARSAIDRMQTLQPGITIGFIREHSTITNPDYLEHFTGGLRKAGLLE